MDVCIYWLIIPPVTDVQKIYDYTVVIGQSRLILVMILFQSLRCI